MCLKCAMHWAFVPLEGITKEESTSAFFVLQSALKGGYLRGRDIFVNRFWTKEDAYDYIYRLQNMFLFGQDLDHRDKFFGLLVQNSKVIDQFGLKQEIDYIRREINWGREEFKPYEKLIWKDIPDLYSYGKKPNVTACYFVNSLWVVNKKLFLLAYADEKR